MSQINFPNSPEDGDEFLAVNGTTYQYDSDTGQWKIVAGPGVQGPAGPSVTGSTGATGVDGPPGPSGSDVTRMAGEVTMWSGSSVPSGWLECNGQSTSGFTALAAIVGANVPDLRGEFVRGFDNGRGVDTGRTLLSTQDDQFETHTHTTRVLLQSTGSNNDTVGGPGSFGDLSTNGITGRNGAETRPRNVALMYIIKT